MDSKFKMYEWKKYKDYYHQENGKIIWHENTPSHVLESYRLYASQIQKLNAFPTERTSTLFSMFEKNKEKPGPNRNKDCIDKAVHFLTVYNQGAIVDTACISSNFVYIDAFKNVYTSLLEMPLRDRKDFKILEMFKKQDKVVVLWNVSRQDYMSLFYFDGNQKICRMQEFVCGK